MPKTGLFYSTETGMNEGVAKMIAEMMPGELDVFMEITKASVDDAASCDCLLIGMPTHGEGEMQEGWADFYPNLDSIDFSGKIVALFGLGDQVGYGHEFVDGLRLLYDKFVKWGATMVGRGTGWTLGSPGGQESGPLLSRARRDRWSGGTDWRPYAKQPRRKATS